MKRICLFQFGFVSTIVVKQFVVMVALILFAANDIMGQEPDNTYNPAPRAKGVGHYDTRDSSHGTEVGSTQNQEGLSQQDSLEDEIYIFPEIGPEFPGGGDALKNYFQSNMLYPQLAKDKGIEGRVNISFVVEKDGSISNIKILRDIGGGCGEEAVRIAKSMPKWKPGKLRGKVVRSQVNTSVKFSLPK